jgi:hypothetical protein
MKLLYIKHITPSIIPLDFDLSFVYGIFFLGMNLQHMDYHSKRKREDTTFQIANLYPEVSHYNCIIFLSICHIHTIYLHDNTTSVTSC